MGRKVLSLRRDDICSVCGSGLTAGTRAEWDSTAKIVTCLTCVDADTESPAPEERPPPLPDHLNPPLDTGPPPPPVTPPTRTHSDPRDSAPEPSSPIDTGVAGASARKEHERRRARHDARIEQKWGTGRLGRVIKVLPDDPQSTKAWGRGSIDHLVIASSGVWVIDAKRYRGKVERRDVGGLFRSDLRLYVGGRDRTKLIEGLGWQRNAVVDALDGHPVPVHQALSFVDADWPLLFAKLLQFDGIWVSWPAKLADLIAQPGPLDDLTIEHTARLLAERLPANR